MGNPALKERVSDLEEMMMQLTYQSMKTDMAVQELAREMKDFKDEMTQFRRESEADRKRRNKEMSTFLSKRREFKEERNVEEKGCNSAWVKMANKMGTVVEDIVAPGLPGIARQYFDIDEFDSFAVRVRKVNPDRTGRREFDVVAESPNLIFIVETKATPRTEYIKGFIRLIPELATWFPVIGEKRLIPVFASLYMTKEQISHLSRHNILAMGMRDDGMDLYNPEIREHLI